MKFIKNLILNNGTYFGKLIKKLYENFLIYKAQVYLQSKNEYRILSYYKKNITSELSRLCDIYGSDKGELINTGHPYPWPSHTYSDFYEKTFSHCRNNVKKVFECGIGTNNPKLASSMGIYGKPGSSLRVWRDYFPNAIVYGADIDKEILFQEERIKTSYINQLDPIAIKSFWEAIGEEDFCLMIDDGLHTFEAGSTLFNHSIDRLSKNGIYIIEDVTPKDFVRYKNFFETKSYIVDYVQLYRGTLGFDNTGLIVIRKQC